ncbi:hypothetical protein EH220_04950 [bacterium]|nr:MAG: hypothetical protein EH220_04950 [bacterium]
MHQQAICPPPNEAAHTGRLPYFEEFEDYFFVEWAFFAAIPAFIGKCFKNPSRALGICMGLLIQNNGEFHLRRKL